MDTHQWKLKFYRNHDGIVPFIEWLEGLDGTIQRRIITRIERLRFGNFGDRKHVGEGVFELRFVFGSGYRIYFGLIGNTIILLLCGGDKSSQNRDITQAKIFLKQYKENLS